MKLLRYGEIGREKPGILDSERSHPRPLADRAGFRRRGAWDGRASTRLKALDLATLPLVEGQPRLGPPVGVVPKFLGIGLNYRDHAEETGMPLPEVPIVFAKASSCVSGPTDPVLQPKGSRRMDFEVELAFVIGTRAKNVVRGGRARPCRRLYDLQRFVGTEPAKGRARRVDQGQEL